jgi:hypothetical protein
MLAKSPPTESGWARVRREFSELFVLHHEVAASPDPRLRLDHARVPAGRQGCRCHRRHPPDAGRGVAADWIAQAQRYATAQQALDTIETTALLEPKALRDGAGRDPSPARWRRASADVPSPVPAPEASGTLGKKRKARGYALKLP